MINPIIKWIADIHWKKFFLIAGSLIFFVGIGLIIYGSYLESESDKLSNEISKLKDKRWESFLILKNVEEDFNKSKEIGLGESTNRTEWLTQDDLDEQYYWEFDLDSSDEESSCFELRKITQGKIVCDSLKEIGLYNQLMAELQSDLFESKAIKNLKANQEKKQEKINKLGKQLSENSPYETYRS